MLRRLLGQNVELALDFSEEDKYVFADPGQFDQVLMNLCVNARDAMPGGGSLTLSTQLVQVDEAFRRTHPWATQDSYILTEVRDTGVGMAPEVMERIFEPFFSTKEENGTGLGLATTYGIVKGHDGMISVASAPGEGTSFLLYLPAVDAKELTRLDEEPPPDSGEGTGTILVAEDEEVVGRVVVDILNRAGYRAMLARDGQQALQLYEEHASAIDLVILDVVMPKVDGREVCLRLRAMQPDLPVLFSSGHSGAVLEPDFIRDTRAYTLPKPYSPTELLVTVRRALEEAARTN
jgi:CheY-like chemotaxis protein